MKKIHITFVGGQPMPVYQGIKFVHPDAVVLIHSKETRKQADLIKAEFEDMQFRVELLDPVDVERAEKLATSLLNQYAEDSVSINIAGGVKPWTYYFSKVFAGHPCVEMLYVDQNSRITNLETKESYDVLFDENVQFRLNGNTLNHYTKFTEYTDEDFETVRQLETIRLFCPKDFKDLLSVFPPHHKDEWRDIVDNRREGILQLDPNRYVEFIKKDKVHIRLTNKKNISKDFFLNSPHAVQLAFNTNWFELKVAIILSKWPYAKEIYHNCHFKLDKGNLDKNEVDLIINTGNKLLFVECKTQLKKPTDIDKFRTVVKNYGGMGSKALFIVGGKLSALAAKKCDESGIISFSLMDRNINDLYSELDRKLFNINSK